MNPVLEVLIWLAVGFMAGPIVEPFLGDYGNYASITTVLASLAVYAWLKGSRQDTDAEEAVPAPIKERKQIRRQARPIKTVATQEPIETTLTESVIEAAKQLAVTPVTTVTPCMYKGAEKP